MGEEKKGEGSVQPSGAVTLSPTVPRACRTDMKEEGREEGMDRETGCREKKKGKTE